MNNKNGSVVRTGTEVSTMKRWWLVAPLSVVLLLLTATPSHAWRGHHWHGGPRVFLGFGFAPWWYPGWYYPPPYYAYAPPTVVVQQPPVYIEQQATVAPAPPVPPAASAPPAQQQYWYYCQPSGAYYPSVATCTEPWIKVPPRAQ